MLTIDLYEYEADKNDMFIMLYFHMSLRTHDWKRFVMKKALLRREKKSVLEEHI